MRSKAFEMRYYNTYYYANILNNILGDPLPYIRTTHDLFENDGTLNFCSPFPKYTALHRFAWFCIECIFDEDLSDECLTNIAKRDDKLLPINRAINAHGIKHTTFTEWLSLQGLDVKDASADELYEYYQELRSEQAYDSFLEQTTDEIFFIVFLNRQLLRHLNFLVAGYISDIDIDGSKPEIQSLFEKSGMLKRQYIPQWVKRAIFFRDRGRCVYCARDLSGLSSLDNSSHYDHIIPLAEGGINDVTNLQLLCELCNLKKGKRNTGTSGNYERWFDKDE